VSTEHARQHLTDIITELSELEQHMNADKDSLSLKWGTLKSWDLHSEKGRELLQRYFDIGSSVSAMDVQDTPEQKALICQMIDECNAETIYLDWDGLHVSKAEAKKYVMEYGIKQEL
jgi:hypothetical protein